MNNDTDNNGPDTQNNIRLPRESQLKMSQYLSKLQVIRRMYWIHMTVARFIFKNDLRAMSSLALQETRWDLIFPWTRQAKEFYQKTLYNEEFLGKMIESGISREELELGLLKLKDLEGNKYWKKQCDEEYVDVEYRLSEVTARLAQHMQECEYASRQAFKDQPQHLVTLGFEESVEDVIERQKRDERRKWKFKSKVDK
ncbi:MAG TPA: hypothetical protein VK469_04755 [Candidatus Kapabacteria bacterium]|nr:hypothetical protein [Candidatus Kapabacteria bacterium]